MRGDNSVAPLRCIVQHRTMVKDTIIIPPVHIAESAQIERSVIGPHVSIGAGVTIYDSRIINSIINDGASIRTAILHNSLIGEKAHVEGALLELNIGDDSEVRLG